MNIEEIASRNERNIRQALEDYRRHTYMTEPMDYVSEEFIKRLAFDNALSKQGLRELFSKSPVWNEELDALVINGNRTHDPDPARVSSLAREILAVPMRDAELAPELRLAIWYFISLSKHEAPIDGTIDAINKLAPGAYALGKKPSRIFKALCVALGVADETKGSDFQKLYAQLADELSAKQIDYKLFVSVNPAHFITMSNPKRDTRGSMLTSCHSFNSTEYSYNNGCSGYARDPYSFIVFTVSDPTDPETLNNRKTTRQVFAYKPGNGVLLQSRMYNTEGGTYGAAENSKPYRDLVQREISALEGLPNLWKTYSYAANSPIKIYSAVGFGGYPDWAYESFDAHLSIRDDCKETCQPFDIGTYGLCIRCGHENQDGLYCESCKSGFTCDYCGYEVDREDELYEVYDSDGEVQHVCDGCFRNEYIRCDECDRYYHENDMTYSEEMAICPQCLDRFDYCDVCETYHRETWPLIDYYGGEERVCGNCADSSCFVCSCCDDYVRREDAFPVHSTDGTETNVCRYCRNKYYSRCPDCGEMYPDSVMIDGLCEECRAKQEEENKKEDNVA